jgi:hypothetical protein
MIAFSSVNLPSFLQYRCNNRRSQPDHLTQCLNRILEFSLSQVLLQKCVEQHSKERYPHDLSK